MCKQVLLVYRGQVLETELREKIKKEKKHKVTLVLTNDTARRMVQKIAEVCGYSEFEGINIFTVDELLNGEMDDMKFDYIVGNPPYQYPQNASGSKNSKKLYKDITEKVFPLLKDTGVISFITPKAIIYNGKQNRVFDLIKDNLRVVDFTANDQFNIGQDVVRWECDKNYQGDIKVIDEDKEWFVDDIGRVCESKHTTLMDVLRKIDFNTSGRTKMNLFRTVGKRGISNDTLGNELTGESPHVVYCNTKNQRHKYTNVSLQKSSRLVAHYVGGWSEGSFISNVQTNEFFFEYDGNNHVNAKTFLDSKLVTYCVHVYATTVKKEAHYNFLNRLPETDFSHPWTDEQLYQEFNLTDEEIQEVETWCKNNPNMLPNKNNPLNEY